MPRLDLKRAVIAEITKKTERDKQVRVGPSSLGGCPRCVGRAMAGVRDPRDDEFSMYPWIGTSVHLNMEHTTFPDAKHELKLVVGEIPGYGEIRGTTDMLLEWDDGGATVVDWKVVSLKRSKSFRLNGVPKEYRYQAMLYGRGCELAGYAVDSVAIVFIPRDSGNINDIYVHEEAYQPEMAERVLQRGEQIWQIVQTDGWESIPADDECYTCNDRGWRG